MTFPRADERIRRDAEKAEQRAFSRVKNRYERQYRRAVQNKDGHLARLILADMRKLYGMDKPKKLALTGGLAITRREEYEFVVKTSKKLKPEDRREIFSHLGAVESNGKRD